MTTEIRIGDALRWTGGRLLAGSPDVVLTDVSIDSRRIGAGALFVAIRGPHHDGHDYLEAARAAGAAAVLVEAGARPAADLGACAVLEVPDTTLALGGLARGHRARFDVPVVGITGSNGKSTVKEMCAAILATRHPCLKNEGNLNNQYGLPLTLLRLESAHRAAVVELGTNHPGEIAALADIARPTVGVLTNVGSAHIEHLGSREGIAREKGALLEALPPDGTAAVNADDPLVMSQVSRTRAAVRRFGLSAEAEVRAEGVSALGERGWAFELVAPEGRVPVHVAGVARTTVINALAAAAGALAAGAGLEDVSAGLEDYRPMSGRMERLSLARNIIVLNDSYNANPQSMEVALRSLSELKGSSRGLAVLGDMGELGGEAATAHRATGRLVAELGIEFLFALGEHAEDVVAGARDGGMEAARTRASADPETLAADVCRVLRGSDWVLVKGSRSMRMERIVKALSEGGVAV